MRGTRKPSSFARIWTRSARRATLEAIVLSADRRAWRCDVHHLVVGAGPVHDLFPRLENCEVGRAERTGWRENLMKRGRVVVLTESLRMELGVSVRRRCQTSGTVAKEFGSQLRQPLGAAK